MAKLSGVEIIIIIGVGFAVFVILFIVAHRQIARFKMRDLLSRPLLKHSQFGASPTYISQIQRKIAEVLDIDVQPQMWEEHWVRFFRNSSERSPSPLPGYVHRARALDFSVLLKLELLKFGPQFDWTAFEDLGDYFERLKTEYPVDRLPVETVMEFVQIYRKCRWDDDEFGEKEYETMCRLVRELLSCLQSLRVTTTTSDKSEVPGFLSREAKEFKDKDRHMSKKFPRGYELLDSEGSTAGSMMTKKSAGHSLARLRKTGNRKGKATKMDEEWEEQVPLHVFHDNPLINFESAPSTSRKGIMKDNLA